MRSFAAFFAAVISIPFVSALGTSCSAALTPSAAASDPFWLQTITHQGTSPYNTASSYAVFRNVKDYGAKGDGVTDDTNAINSAITAGTRCGYPNNCASSTLTPALVYFPSGTYVVSNSLISYYYTSMVGDKKNPPVLKATAAFPSNTAVIDADIYIPGASGAEWYTNQNNFFRSIRNIVIDITAIPSGNGGIGVHWQVAQATSLVNVVVNMSTASGNNHQGIYMENGSGGVMTDLVLNGGQYGLSVGNQQFTVRNVTVNNAATAVKATWNWGWTFQKVTINNCGVGFALATGGVTKDTQTVGAESIVDVTVSNTPIFLQTSTAQTSTLSGSIVVENLKLTSVPKAVVDGAGTTILAGGTLTIPQWIQGNVYSGSSSTGSYKQATYTPPTKPSTLTTSSGVFGRSRPQYEAYAASQFQSVKSAGAKGDGKTDDTAALQAVINQYWGCKIIFFDAGIYLITDTLKIPAGSQIVGELWSVVQASGSNFADSSNPRVAVQVGTTGDTAATEISDLVFTTKSGSAGAIIVEWNVGESSQGSAAMWDSHVRVGGFTGSGMQVSNCGNTTTHTTAACTGAYLSMHLTSGSSAYLENVWLWTADHDLDDPAQGELDIYSGRGMLIEASGPVWLIGTASEHHALYQYNLNNVRAVYIALIQTETPYWQPTPAAPSPFTINSALSDPSFASGASAWALYIQKSSGVHGYGVNMYSFFINWDQTCVNTVAYNCQAQIASVDTASEGIYLYNIATLGVTYQLSLGGTGLINQSLNRDGFQSVVGFWSSTNGGSLGSVSVTPASSTTTVSTTTAKGTTTTTSAATTTTTTSSVAGKCNGVSYTSSQVCDNGHVCSTGQLWCGTACYNPSTSCCSANVITATSSTGCKCGTSGQVFDPANYVCDNSVLCPSGTLSCGAACYSPSSYSCCNAALTVVGSGC